MEPVIKLLHPEVEESTDKRAIRTYPAPDNTMKTFLKRYNPSDSPMGFVIAVRASGPLVVVFIDGAGLPFLTTTVHPVGFKMVKLAQQAEKGDVVVMNINGTDIGLPPNNARQVGAALLRKSDTADDWQLKHRRRAAQ
jgi:hypothetical protein